MSWGALSVYVQHYSFYNSYYFKKLNPECAANDNDGPAEMLANLSYFAAVFLFQVPHTDRLCKTDKDCERGAWDELSHGTGPSLFSFLCFVLLVLENLCSSFTVLVFLLWTFDAA